MEVCKRCYGFDGNHKEGCVLRSPEIHLPLGFENPNLARTNITDVVSRNYSKLGACEICGSKSHETDSCSKKEKSINYIPIEKNNDRDLFIKNTLCDFCHSKTGVHMSGCVHQGIERSLPPLELRSMLLGRSMETPDSSIPPSVAYRRLQSYINTTYTALGQEVPPAVQSALEVLAGEVERLPAFLKEQIVFTNTEIIYTEKGDPIRIHKPE